MDSNSTVHESSEVMHILAQLMPKRRTDNGCLVTLIAVRLCLSVAEKMEGTVVTLGDVVLGIIVSVLSISFDVPNSGFC